ncbi:MAG: glycoside hydrolase family 2, partial [Lachnospiraceae bacterium]|nr:glycoside hydrolase family 2 [Lachnospiraceae bacterium]
VKVKDELDHTYPYGKQKYKRGGMWYTPIMGIWQSVWIESVCKDYIKDIEITPYLDRISVNVLGGEAPFNVQVSFDKETVFEGSFDAPFFQINIKDPKHWTPDTPFLYDIKISTKDDEIKSYFGLRTVEIKKVKGVSRILLNKKPVFFNGVLDQGYFPEGIFTPNSEKTYEDDILRLKELGINTIRKHIKIEPECFYEACDRLGMFVFQDMVNNGDYKFFRDTLYPTFISKKKDDTKGKHPEETMYFFESQMEETLAHLYNFPSIVYYTIFNEGWGQFDSDIMYNIVKAMDRTRIIDSTSGWFWQEESDVDSLHVYFKPVKIKPSDRPIIVSEFGGFSYKEEGHIFNTKKSYGYGGEKTKEALTKRIENLYLNEIVPAIKDGLCGTIYTQITDVEDEINGFYTYDRKLCKVDKDVMKEIAKKLKI